VGQGVWGGGFTSFDPDRDRPGHQISSKTVWDPGDRIVTLKTGGGSGTEEGEMVGVCSCCPRSLTALRLKPGVDWTPVGAMGEWLAEWTEELAGHEGAGRSALPKRPDSYDYPGWDANQHALPFILARAVMDHPGPEGGKFVTPCNVQWWEWADVGFENDNYKVPTRDWADQAPKMHESPLFGVFSDFASYRHVPKQNPKCNKPSTVYFADTPSLAVFGSSTTMLGFEMRIVGTGECAGQYIALRCDIKVHSASRFSAYCDNGGKGIHHEGDGKWPGKPTEPPPPALVGLDNREAEDFKREALRDYVRRPKW